MRNYYYLQYQILLFSIFIYNLGFTIYEFPYAQRIYSVDAGYNINYNLHGFFYYFYSYLVNHVDLLKFVFLVKIIFAVGILFKSTRKISLLMLVLHNVVFEDLSNLNSPESGFLNILYLALIGMPESKFQLFKSHTKKFWMYPLLHQKIVWIIAAAGYSIAGFYKSISPAWQDGSALELALVHLHEGRFDFGPMFSYPGIAQISIALTYFTLLIELLALPMLCHRYLRLASFIFLTGMQLMILIVMDISQVSLGMLVYHIYLFEPKWLRLCRFRKD